MSNKTKVLMVCLGNICRSPLAEAILKSKVNSEEIGVDPAGTSDYHIGDPPDQRAINTGKRYNLDLSHQRSRQFKLQDFDEFDFIFVMDHANYQHVISLARNEKDKEKVSLILEKIAPDKQLDVPDPFFGKGEENFPAVYDLLDEACKEIAKELSST